MSRIERHGLGASYRQTAFRLTNTVGIGLLAVGALAATLVLGRPKREIVEPDHEGALVPGEPAPVTLRLDALRAAGL